KLETKGVIAMTLLTLVLMNTGCEDKIDSPAVNPSEGKTVEVMLDLGITDEEDGTGASTSPGSKTGYGSNSRSAFEVVPVSGVQTKAGTDKPDQLYNLEIWQYDANGNKINSQKYGQVLGNKAIGSSFTATLTEADNCQLLLIARGAIADFSSLSNKSLSDVQAMAVKVEGSKINAIPTDATGSGLANMPYYLLLKDVNITSDGKIQSPAGKDVRLLLKRLAVKVQLDWTISPAMINAGYVLKEVKLCQAPAHYRLVPQTETTDKWGDVYPTSVAEFVDVYRLTGTDLVNAGNSKFVWIPANARGISSYATSPIYRNKENANAAATYAEFVVDNSVKKERLYYRAYLGGNETNDFNLLENNNYHWTVNINNANYTNDPRIQLLDQTPVISTNLQPTANCFMMRPGTNICFNPYKHEAGPDGWNTVLASSGSIQPGKEIKKVKVLWQNKDTGTSGELVMGYAISESNHQNLVNLTDGNRVDNARIHLKVPVTSGGNAVVAAYGDDEAKALWSWHIWVSDYVPALLGNFTEGDVNSRTNAIAIAQNATRGGMVHTYQGASWTNSSGTFYKKIIMDRNLGAIRAVPALNSNIESARTYGVLYQWGRKDPMPGSADGSYEEINTIFNADGVTIPLSKSGGGNQENSIANPSTFYYNMYLADDSWGPITKTIYDPCPKGWKVPDFYPGETTVMFDGFAFGSNLALLNDQRWFTTAISQSSAKINATNGLLYLYPGETYMDYTTKSAWFPMYWMRERDSGNLRRTDACFVMYSARVSNSVLGFPTAYYTEVKAHGVLMFTTGATAVRSYGMSVRCIQEK
ncbi:DUF4906 domain-containing protein, partial [Parabacteroides leei]